MRVSGFTFLRNAEKLGYPFKESILSVLPIVDEFIIALGPCEDNTEAILRSINTSKIKIINTQWNEQMREKGYVYGQQKMIAQFNCTGDWAFYLEGDEVLHEKDLNTIYKAMEENLENPEVEALAFKYLHFYGNSSTYVYSPAWYRTEARIIRNKIRTIAPDGLYWKVLYKRNKLRNPKGKLIDATIYHYGWVKSEEQMNAKWQYVKKYWNHNPETTIYANIDHKILKEFKGTHPKLIQDWLPKADGIFKADPNYKLTKREKKHRIAMIIEKLFKVDLSHKHYKSIK